MDQACNRAANQIPSPHKQRENPDATTTILLIRLLGQFSYPLLDRLSSLFFLLMVLYDG
jgi:hypothetical protein